MYGFVHFAPCACPNKNAVCSKRQSSYGPGRLDPGEDGAAEPGAGPGMAGWKSGSEALSQNWVQICFKASSMALRAFL